MAEAAPFLGFYAFGVSRASARLTSLRATCAERSRSTPFKFLVSRLTLLRASPFWFNVQRLMFNHLRKRLLTFN